jgi:hypothetical protein
MRDPSVFVYAILGMLALGLLPVLFTWARRRLAGGAAPELERLRREQEARVRKLLEKDTHIRLDDGRIVPKCRHCSMAATRRPLKWVRDDGFFDLIRRAFGAPARVRVGQEAFDEALYCESHEALAHEEFRIELAKYESDRAGQERDWEVRRARFQQTGIHSRLDEHIQKHEREIGGRKRRNEVTAKVVPFSARSTGTDTK